MRDNSGKDIPAGSKGKRMRLFSRFMNIINGFISRAKHRAWEVTGGTRGLKGLNNSKCFLYPGPVFTLFFKLSSLAGLAL